MGAVVDRVIQNADTLHKVTTGLFSINIATGLICAALASPLHDVMVSKMPEAVVQKKIIGMVELWSSVYGSPVHPKAFFAFLAICKISGAFAFLGLFGPYLDSVAGCCWMLYFCGAIYNQLKLDEPVMPAALFMMLLLVRLFVSRFVGMQHQHRQSDSSKTK